MDRDQGQRLRLGISACLLGEPVRYDGSHRRDPVATERLGPLVDWVAVCPEAEAGLGVPREPIRLEHDPRSPRVRGIDTGDDHTHALRGWTKQRLDSIGVEDLDGFVLKSRSPSCEPVAVEVFGSDGAIGTSPGLFAVALRDRDAGLPLCDEEDLGEPPRRRHFLERARVRQRCRRVRRESIGAAQVSTRQKDLELAAAHDLLLLAREQSPLGDTVCDFQHLCSELQIRMSAPCTAAGHARALRRGLSRLGLLDEPARWALAVLACDVEIGRVDPEVGRQLLRALAHAVEDPWLRAQHYLEPVPDAWSDRASTRDDAPSRQDTRPHSR